MYRFLGGLFDADSSLDHAHVLDKVRRCACRTPVLAQIYSCHLSPAPSAWVACARCCSNGNLGWVHWF